MKTMWRSTFALCLLALAPTVYGQLFFPGGTDVYLTRKNNGNNEVLVVDGSHRDTSYFKIVDPKGKNGEVAFLKSVSALAQTEGSENPYLLAVASGGTEVGDFNPSEYGHFDALGNPIVTPQAVAASPQPLVVKVSNDADSLAVTPDGFYSVVVGANSSTPVSLVDLVAKKEVFKFAAESNVTHVATFDDGESAVIVANIPPANATNRLRRLRIVEPGKLVDTGESLTALSVRTAGSDSYRFKKVFAVPGSQVGVAIAEFGNPHIVTFSIPGLQVLDKRDSPAGDSAAVNSTGDRLYVRGYSVANGGFVTGITLDPVTGALGASPVVSFPVGQSSDFATNFGNALEVSPDGAQIIVTEGTGFPNSPATPRLTYFNATTGAREDFLELPGTSSPTLVSTLPSAARALAPAPSTVLLAKGIAPPGTLGGVGQPPTDALLASFGVPAIDDGEHVAFTAKWTSATRAKGPGIFTETGCVAVVGGPVPGLNGATFKTLLDPLLQAGHIAFLATASGVPAAQASLVLSDAPTGALAVVAQSGLAADGAGDAKFRTFKAIGVAGSSVAVLAQLTGGTGTSRVTAANEVGLWLTDATHGLTLVLRESGMVGGLKVGTIVSFIVGNGSPGQGRGWVRTDGTTPEVLALVTFTDRTQAVVSATFGNVAVIESRSGPGGLGAPEIAGATFASYGVPTANAAGDVAYAGSMTVGPGGVLRADARAVFASNASGTFTPLARVTKPVDPANATGPKFSVLKDPVLSGTGALAFPATLSGGGLKGLAITTLWHRPAGGALTLLAQGSKRPPGLPAAAQFRAFTSLAISEKGPLFAATLLPGKGRVTAANAKGVWGADSAGTLRLLFRTGQKVGGKTVRDFTALTSVTGSLGTTHSFNTQGTVAWRATFTDGSTAIVKTKAP